MIRVLLVDDHPLVIDGLTAALDADPGIEVVGRAKTLADGRSELHRLKPDVMVVDIRLPDGSGLQLLGLLPATASLVLSSYGTPQHIDAARRLGARGFHLKTASSRTLVDAVKRIALGRSAFDPGIRREAREGDWMPLSERQREIVRLLLLGRSNDEIGAQLHVSEKTVEAHLSRMFRRFDVVTRIDLALRAEREGWLDLPPIEQGPDGLT